MGVPSSQVAAHWIKQELDSTEWIPLREVAFATVRRRWVGRSDGEIWDYVEENLPFVAEHLRDSAGDCVVDGAVPQFEIDN